MTCEEALLLVSGHLDGENTAEEERALQQHLCSCSQCASVMYAYEQIDTALSAAEEKAPADLRTCIMEQIKAESRKKKYRPWGGIAIAAAFCLTIGLGSMWDLNTDTGLQTVSQTQSRTITQKSTVPDGAQLAQVYAEENGAAVVVVHELYYEIEIYPCQTTKEGYVMYRLPDYASAVSLGENYGCAVCEPSGFVDQTVSYALLVP